MLTFSPSMDPFSLDVLRDGKSIGFLQWHRNKPAHFIQWTGNGSSVTIDEMRQIIREYETLWRIKT